MGVYSGTYCMASTSLVDSILCLRLEKSLFRVVPLVLASIWSCYLERAEG